MNIETKVESERGCGYRHKGLYIIGGKFGEPCGKLPILLTVCPCCNAGIKFSRGFQWISHLIVREHPCVLELNDACKKCAVWKGGLEWYGMMWVGEKFYKTPEDFMEEGDVMGISKRIGAIPNEFEVGVDWILLAHRKAVPVSEGGKTVYKPGIFQAFKPTHFEYVVGGDESVEELEAKEKRGIKLVRIVKESDAQLTLENE